MAGTDIESLLNENPFPSFDSEEEDQNQEQNQDTQNEDPVKAKEAEIARLKAELEEANKKAAKAAAAPVQQQYQPPVDPSAEKAKRAQLAKEYEAQFLANPGESILQIVEAAKQEAYRAAQQAFIPAAQTGIRFSVSNFKNARRGDPFFAAAEEEFDELVDKFKAQASPNLTPDQIEEGVKTLYKMAVGAAVMKKGPNKRQNEPPPYSAGSSRGSGRNTFKGRTLTKAQQAMITTAREEYGYDDKQIEALLEGDDE